MKRWVFLLCVLGLPAYGQSGISSTSCTAGSTAVPKPFAFETVTVSTSAIGLTAATYNAPSTGQPPAVMAFLTTEDDTMRFRVDGADPTSSVGHEVASGTGLIVCTASLPKLKMIRSGAADVPVSVTYFNLAQP